MAKNEKTSEKVASKAGSLLHLIDTTIKDLQHAITVLDVAKSVIASALTQAPDKKKKK